MSASVQPDQDYFALAGRIRAHLSTHPGDRQAQDDLRYVVSKMKGATAATNAQELAGVQGTPTPNPGMAIASGLGQAATDIPKGVLNLVTHPVQSLGQLSGVNQWSHIAQTMRDPEANAAERLDALMRAIPGLNMGYTAERGLLEATGAKSDSPAPLQEQAHRAGNVLSLALLGVNPKTPLRYITRNFIPKGLRPPILDRLAEAPAAPEDAAAGTGGEEEILAGRPVSQLRAELMKQTSAGPQQEALVENTINRLRAQLRPRATTLPVEGEVSAGFPEEPTPTLGQALSRATHAAQPISDGPPGSGAAKLEPIPETGGRGFTAEGPPTPPVPSTPTIAEMQGLASSRLIGDDPVAQAIAKQTVQRQIAAGTRGPRGGALVGSRAVADQSTIELMANRIAKASVEQLQDALNMPGEDWVQAAIQKELARRGAP